MKLHGVINASPDSLAEFSVALTVDDALARARTLLDEGCEGIDLGGAGSTQYAERVDVEAEWDRLDGKVQALAALGVDLSVDTWQPEIMARALNAGANLMNAADGMQNPAMIEVAASGNCQVILPFISGADPKAMELVTGDPYETILAWFEEALERLSVAGIGQERIVIDPGTGFGPSDWDWQDRYRYQLAVYSGLDKLRTFGLPVYVALPWKMDGGRRELLEILLTVGFDYGRTHLPAQILQVQAELAFKE